ncbi:hypothetical protein QVD17_00571 [Tagetes erecta]|uniref:Uncharacterized protein n=1 Tax=Tagetes erecta TaxID=13708 RepID=A0AAD8LAG0_TARER|nr:hypothetical protein QVD17_00571 [Tagetes erecta]
MAAYSFVVSSSSSIIYTILQSNIQIQRLEVALFIYLFIITYVFCKPHPHFFHFQLPFFFFRSPPAFLGFSRLYMLHITQLLQIFRQ